LKKLIIFILGWTGNCVTKTRRLLFACCFLILVFAITLPAQKSDTDLNVSPNVTFHISSIEKIFNEPDMVLKDVKGFWNNEAPYIATKKWEPPGYPINYNEFERIVKELAMKDEKMRAGNESFDFARRIIEAAPNFRASAIEHVCSYLPKETVLEAKVLLACFIYLGKPEPRFSPNAFVVGPDIVINVSSKYWKNQTSEVLHTLSHELFHVGYHWHHNSLPLQDANTNQKMIDHILWQLQNEGLATYTAYKLREDLPTQQLEDYLLLDNLLEVKRLFTDINDLLQQAKTLSPTEIREAVIDRGILKRGFYVVGAYMAQQIEKKLGKDMLVSSVSKGPLYFAKLYDSISDKELEINYSMPKGIK